MKLELHTFCDETVLMFEGELLTDVWPNNETGDALLLVGGVAGVVGVAGELDCPKIII